MEDKRVSLPVKDVCVLAVVLLLVFGAAVAGAAYMGRNTGWDEGYSAGIDHGTGMLSPAVVGEVYELKLVGQKDGRYHDMEVTYGYQKDNQAIYKQLPCDAKAGDHITCVRPEDDLVMVRAK